MNQLTMPPSPASPPQQPRTEWVVNMLIVASACTLETLPIFCWLLMLAAIDTNNPDNATMPFWWMWLLIVAVYWLGALFLRGAEADPRRRRINTLSLTAAIVVLAPLSLLATYLLSPATQDFLAGSGDSNGPFGLALLVGWLWWRGLFLSRRRTMRGGIYTRFIAALGGTIAALAGAAAIPGETRDLTASYLALLLALLLFVGMMGLTLSQARDTRDTMRAAYRGSQPLEMPPVFTRSWLAASLSLSLGVSLLALVLATLISRQSVRILAIAAGNIVNGLLDAMQFVLAPVFFLLYLALNKPVEWLSSLIHGWRPLPLQPPPPPSCTPAGTSTGVGTPASGTTLPGNQCIHTANSPVSNLLPQEWLTAMRWGAVILIILVAIVLLARVLSRLSEWRRVRAFTEERTMLDVSEILGGRWRRFLDSFRRRPAVEEVVADDLAAGSVRRVYRDTLGVASARGYTRRAAETPQEYQRRITHDDPLSPGATPPPGVVGALAELTDAYERARYGYPDPKDTPPASPETVSAAETVQRWLTERHDEERPAR